MASLKSFLYVVAPILDLTGAALYERQRVLTTLGALKAAPGRGPGSGVPLTAENVAVVIISVLAAETLSDIGQTVVSLCDAHVSRTSPGGKRFRRSPSPTFKAEVARALSGEPLASCNPPYDTAHSIGVSRPWRGRIRVTPDESVEFNDNEPFLLDPITITAEIEYDTLKRLIDVTRGALSQLAEEEDEDG